jgi:hypothetical protein
MIALPTAWGYIEAMGLVVQRSCLSRPAEQAHNNNFCLGALRGERDIGRSAGFREG